MNPYLSHIEKENLCHLIVLNDELENIINEYAKGKSTDKTFLADLRHAKTRTLRAINKRLSYMDSEAIIDLLRNSKKLMVKFIPRAEIAKVNRELLELRSTLPMAVDDFFDWYSWLIDYTCLKCKREDFKECVGRKILMKYEVFPVNPAATDVCQYSYVQADQGVGAVGEALLTAIG